VQDEVGPYRRGWIRLSGLASVLLASVLWHCSIDQRLTESVSPPTIKDAVYLGTQTCLECHTEHQQRMESTLHGKILLTSVARTDLQRHGCEACHGPGSRHIQDYTDRSAIITFGQGSPQSAVAQNAVCLQCHMKGQRLFWQGSSHELRDVSCVSCHSVHNAQTRHANLKASSQLQLCTQCHAMKTATAFNWAHMPVREGKMQCADCHNVHGSLTESLIRENSVNENCYRCHADRRGPFLYEHPPVRENCTTCHVAHGSNNPRLLRIRPPRLCQQCHNEAGHPSTAFGLPGGLADRRMLGRSCLSCHVNIHGSNHPSGFAFTR